MTPDGFSLRAHLLKALATPLFALVLGSGTIAYWLAVHYSNQVFDRALCDLAHNLGQQITLSGNRIEQDLPRLANTLLDPESSDRVYWRIEGPDGLTAGIDTWLGNGTGHTQYREARLFYAWYNARQVRAVRLQVQDQHVGASPGDVYVIEVAETLDRRQTAANEILLSVSIPLLLLLVLGSILLSIILKHELTPLQLLADKLNQQTARSLEALDEKAVPDEVRPLTSAMNALLTRLREALDAQRHFIADAAHQLRTPLTSLKLYADRAAQARSWNEVRPTLFELQNSANRAIRLSNQLLSLARIEPGEQIAQFTHLDIAALAFETGAEWVPRALQCGIDLGFDAHAEDNASPPPLWVAGDALLLREALSNLLDNAVKYVPHRGSRINLRTAADERTAAVIIEDNGPGIPVAQRSAAFKRFFRADNQGIGGSGLGLAIVHDIITLHRGTIQIEDGIDGRGTRFVIRLPRVPHSHYPNRPSTTEICRDAEINLH